MHTTRKDNHGGQKKQAVHEHKHVHDDTDEDDEHNNNNNNNSRRNTAASIASSSIDDQDAEEPDVSRLAGSTDSLDSLGGISSHVTARLRGARGGSHNHPASAARSRFAADFDCCERLGQGAFGHVFKVEHRLDRQIYAVKRLRLPPACETGFMHEEEKLMREVSTLSRLANEHVVRYYQAWIEETPEGEGDFDGEEDQDDLFASLMATPADDLSKSSDTFVNPIHMSLEEELDAALEEDGDINCCRHHHDDDDDDDDNDDDDASDNTSQDETDTDRNTDNEDGDDDGNKQKQQRHSRKPKHSAALDSPDRKKLKKKKDSKAAKKQTSTTTSAAAAAATVPARTSKKRLQLASTATTVTPALMYRFLFIQMEFCELTLAQVLGARVLRPGETVWRLFSQILQGLAYIHNKGIIHRDLKPPNVFVSCDGLGIAQLTVEELVRLPLETLGQLKLKLGDFGLAKEAPAADGLHRSSYSWMNLAVLSPRTEQSAQPDDTTDIGTVLYTPPDPQPKWGRKTDMYALGVILFEMLVPFNTGMERIVTLRDLRRPQLSFPPDFEQQNFEAAIIIRRLLHKDGSRRPSAGELLRTVTQIINGIRSARLRRNDSEPSLQQMESSDSVVPTISSSSSAVAAGVAAAAAAAVAVGDVLPLDVDPLSPVPRPCLTKQCQDKEFEQLLEWYEATTSPTDPLTAAAAAAAAAAAGNRVHLVSVSSVDEGLPSQRSTVSTGCGGCCSCACACKCGGAPSSLHAAPSSGVESIGSPSKTSLSASPSSPTPHRAGRHSRQPDRRQRRGILTIGDGQDDDDEDDDGDNDDHEVDDQESEFGNEEDFEGKDTTARIKDAVSASDDSAGRQRTGGRRRAEQSKSEECRSCTDDDAAVGSPPRTTTLHSYLCPTALAARGGPARRFPLPPPASFDGAESLLGRSCTSVSDVCGGSAGAAAGAGVGCDGRDGSPPAEDALLTRLHMQDRIIAHLRMRLDAKDREISLLQALLGRPARPEPVLSASVSSASTLVPAAAAVSTATTVTSPASLIPPSSLQAQSSSSSSSPTSPSQASPTSTAAATAATAAAPTQQAAQPQHKVPTASGSDSKVSTTKPKRLSHDEREREHQQHSHPHPVHQAPHPPHPTSPAASSRTRLVQALVQTSHPMYTAT